MKKLSVVMLILIGILLGCIIFLYQKIPKIGYVDSNELYNNFQMKKELEAKLDKFQNQQKAVEDSMMNSLKIMNNELDIERVKDPKKEREYNYRKLDYINKSQENKDAFTEKRQIAMENIFKQLNGYSREYGAKNNYDVILGANGNGALMYSKESYNITDKVIKYANNRYKGMTE